MKETNYDLKNVTINIPFLYLQKIEGLIKIGSVRSRSDGIRRALRSYLVYEFGNLVDFGAMKEGLANEIIKRIESIDLSEIDKNKNSRNNRVKGKKKEDLLLIDKF